LLVPLHIFINLFCMRAFSTVESVVAELEQRHKGLAFQTKKCCSISIASQPTADGM
jgi:hypothetical protein